MFSELCSAVSSHFQQAIFSGPLAEYEQAAKITEQQKMEALLVVQGYSQPVTKWPLLSPGTAAGLRLEAAGHGTEFSLIAADGLTTVLLNKPYNQKEGLFDSV